MGCSGGRHELPADRASVLDLAAHGGCRDAWSAGWQDAMSGGALTSALWED